MPLSVISWLRKIRSAVMGDGSLRPLQLVDADEDARRFDAVVQAMAGGPAQLRAPQPVFAIVAEVARLAVLGRAAGRTAGSP